MKNSYFHLPITTFALCIVYDSDLFIFIFCCIINKFCCVINIFCCIINKRWEPKSCFINDQRKIRCVIVGPGLIIIVCIGIFLIILIVREIVVEWMLCCPTCRVVLTLPGQKVKVFLDRKWKWTSFPQTIQVWPAAICMVQLPKISLCWFLRLAKVISSTFCLCGSFVKRSPLSANCVQTVFPL